MRKLLDYVHRLLEGLMFALLWVLILFVSLQILSRNLTVIPTFMWTEEIARFCFVWMILIGATIGVREGLHFDIDLLPGLSDKNQRRVAVLTNLLVLIFALIFVYYGAEFAIYGRYLTSDISEVPLWMIYIAWPFCGLISALFLVERMIWEPRSSHGVSGV